MNSIFKIFKHLSILVIGLTLSYQSMADTLVSNEKSQAEQIVVDFYDKIFIQRGGDIRKIAEQFVHEDYIQHNPYVATGREAFITAISGWMKVKPATSKTVIKRVFTSGDYIILHLHSFNTAKKSPGRAGVDIFRVENGKIIEHWDVWQKIPERMPHNNGMV